MEYAVDSSIPNVAKSGDAVLYGCSDLISPDIGRRAGAYQGVNCFVSESLSGNGGGAGRSSNSSFRVLHTS